MKAFKLKYASGEQDIVYGETALAVIREYDLCTKEHVKTRVIELNGEQGAIAMAALQTKRSKKTSPSTKNTNGI